jgi:hypothetical protein
MEVSHEIRVSFLRDANYQHWATRQLTVGKLCVLLSTDNVLSTILEPHIIVGSHAWSHPRLMASAQVG